MALLSDLHQTLTWLQYIGARYAEEDPERDALKLAGDCVRREIRGLEAASYELAEECRARFGS